MVIEDVIIIFFNSVPGTVWAILGAVWFGLTFQSPVFVQVLIIIPFSLINVSEGVKAIGSEDVEMGRSFCRRSWAILWRIELPLLRPFIIAAGRISYGVCWKVSLIAELFGARSGLGYMMQHAQDLGFVNEIIAICFMIIIFVVLGERLVWIPLARRFGVAAVDSAEPGMLRRGGCQISGRAAVKQVNLRNPAHRTGRAWTCCPRLGSRSSCR